jgi:hypothetical protein
MRMGRGMLALASAGVLTVGCAGVSPESRVSAASASALPMSVACEPGQRAIVRPAALDGTLTSQVECRSVETAAPMAAPVATMAVPVNAPMASAAPVPYAQVRPAVYEQPVDAQTVSYRPERSEPRVVQTRVERRPVRSVKKSAIIIGSSAGAGAGLGAAIGGKKGALIGAVVGGGGATLWDQITRHKR